MDSIAVETLCEIFSHLDWRGLMSAKLTCRTWRNALTARHFWYLKITNLLSEPGVTRPEEPLADYSVSELESWVIKCLRAQEYWTVEQSNSRPLALDNKGVVIRKYQGINRDFNWQVLLPGGRWVLTHYDDEFLSYDLEDHMNEKAVPINPHESHSEIFKEMFVDLETLWIDPTKEKLSLRLVLQSDVPWSEKDRVSIWQIDLVGHGKEASLQAQLIKKLQSNHTRNTMLAAMTGDLLVERLIIDSEGHSHHIADPSCLYLTRYMEIAESEYREKRIRAQFMEHEVELDSHGPATIRVTSNNKIIRIVNGWIEIYDIPESRTFKSTILTPLHRCTFKHLDTSWYFSEQFAFQNNMWLVYGYRSELRLTRFLENGNYALKTVTLGSLNTDTRFEYTLSLIGPSSSITADGNNLVSIFHYSWDSSMNCTVFQHKHIHGLELPATEYEVEILGVDESKGRIVLRAVEYRKPSSKCTIIAIELMG